MCRLIAEMRGFIFKTLCSTKLFRLYFCCQTLKYGIRTKLFPSFLNFHRNKKLLRYLTKCLVYKIISIVKCLVFMLQLLRIPVIEKTLISVDFNKLRGRDLV